MAPGRLTVAIWMNSCGSAAGKVPVSYGEECRSHRVTHLYLPNPRNLPVHYRNVAGMAGCRAGLAMEWDDFI